MKPITNDIRKWLQRNGSQKIRVTWCNGFVDSSVYDAKMINWDVTTDSFHATHIERA